MRVEPIPTGVRAIRSLELPPPKVAPGRQSPFLMGSSSIVEPTLWVRPFRALAMTQEGAHVTLGRRA